MMTTFLIMQKIYTQLNSEFLASQRCLNYSHWCSKHALEGGAVFMREFAQRNISQMARAFTYIKQIGFTPVVEQPAIQMSPAYSLEAALQQCLADNQVCQEKLTELNEEVMTRNNPRALIFLESMRARLQQNSDLLHQALSKVRNVLESGHDEYQADQQLRYLVNQQYH